MMLWKAETVGGIETKELCVGYRNSEILIHCRLSPGRKGHLLFLHGLRMRDNRGFRKYARTLEQHSNPRAFYDRISDFIHTLA
jgi:hypothetical protein